jgi:hypothetical protein
MHEMQYVRHAAGNADTRTFARRTKSERPDPVSGAIERYSFSFLAVFALERLNISFVA